MTKIILFQCLLGPLLAYTASNSFWKIMPFLNQNLKGIPSIFKSQPRPKTLEGQLIILKPKNWTRGKRKGTPHIYFRILQFYRRTKNKIFAKNGEAARPIKDRWWCARTKARPRLVKHGWRARLQCLWISMECCLVFTLVNENTGEFHTASYISSGETRDKFKIKILNPIYFFSKETLQTIAFNATSEIYAPKMMPNTIFT